MSMEVVQPPKDEARFAEVGKELFAAARDLGMNLEVDGFLNAWISGMRVIVERDDQSRKIVGMVLLRQGMQWNKNRHTASVLEIRGVDLNRLMEFTKQVAAAMGTESLFVESADMLPVLLKRTIESMTQYQLSPDDNEVREALIKVFALDYPNQKLLNVIEYSLQ